MRTNHLRSNNHDAAAAGDKGAPLKHRFDEPHHAVRPARDDFRRRHGQTIPAVACDAAPPVCAVEPQAVGIVAAAHEGGGAGKVERAELLVALKWPVRENQTHEFRLMLCTHSCAK